MKRILAAFLIILFSVITVSCMPQPSSLPTPATTAAAVIGIRGRITSRTQTNGGLTILVEGEKTADTLYDKANVRVTDKTAIYKKGQNRAYEMSSLTIGATVEVIFEGPVAESYPVQGTASAVRIIAQ